MNPAAAALSWVLAWAPETQPQYDFDVVDVTVDRGPTATVVLAHGKDGEVLSEVVVWQDDTGAARLDVNFDDGLAAMSVTYDGETTTTSVENEPLPGETSCWD